MRILIVEDEPKTAAYVPKGLSEHGYVDRRRERRASTGCTLRRTASYDLSCST